MVMSMTEKRLIVDENYNLVDTVTGEWLDDTQVFDLANKLAEKNQNLQFLIIEMLDFIKENDGVTRQEMSDWWNKKVMSE